MLVQVSEKQFAVHYGYDRFRRARRRKWAVFKCPRCGENFPLAVTYSKTQKSCGCGQSRATHGESHTAIYKTWQNTQRKGRHVHERWRVYENFRDDMAPRPEGAILSITDDALGYAPGNCEWLTHEERCVRAGTAQYLELNGVRKTVLNWSKEPGAVSADNIRSRINLGWSLQEAIFTKVRGAPEWTASPASTD